MINNYQKLSTGRKNLIRQMQAINFGRIEYLSIKNGDPVVDSFTKVTREIKFGGDNGPRPEMSDSDFALKSQVLDLFRQFDQISSAQIDLIEIKHGMPFRMLVKE